MNDKILTGIQLNATTNEKTKFNKNTFCKERGII